MHPFSPAYLALFEKGELEARTALAYEHLTRCDICPWNCRKDRTAGKLGICRTAGRARVSSYGPHLGEEEPLRGWRGSGAIFFSGCNMLCQFCQNSDISQTGGGEEVDAPTLANMMLALQQQGCHNINLVSPTHVIPQILAAVQIAAGQGLRLPLVYNTGGYDSTLALESLDGVVDIYLPDMKFASRQIGLHYAKVRDYPKFNQAAVREMHRQVGDLQLNAEGLAVRGLLVRHLVLPNDLAGTPEIVRFLAGEISKDTHLNLMDQYFPAYNASQFPKLARPLHSQEYEAAHQAARAAGLRNL